MKRGTLLTNYSPYSQKNVQECRCGAETCRGVLGPRPREKEQRAKESRADDLKKPSPRLNTIAGMKRKRSRLPASQTIKSGIKNAVSKTRSTVSRSAASRRATAETKMTARATVTQASAKTKTTARTRAPTSAARSRSNQLSRPSAETKKRILTKSTSRSRSTKEKDESQPVRKRNNQYTVRRRNNQYTKGTVKPKNPTARSTRARK